MSYEFQLRPHQPYGLILQCSLILNPRVLSESLEISATVDIGTQCICVNIVSPRGLLFGINKSIYAFMSLAVSSLINSSTESSGKQGWYSNFCFRCNIIWYHLLFLKSYPNECSLLKSVCYKCSLIPSCWSWLHSSPAFWCRVTLWSTVHIC